MSDDFDRRSFIRRTSMGAAAVGALTVAGSSVLGTTVADAATPSATPRESVIDGSDVIAHVIDARTGEIAILSGDKEIKCVNRDLAQQLVRLAK